jgi:diguanylate cyclase (GGDEF)-like protein
LERIPVNDVPILPKVLIVDGDRASCEQLSQLVGEAGGEPVVAPSSAAALRLGRSTQLLLLAGATGAEALARLAAAYPALPRIYWCGAPVDEQPAEEKSRLRAALRAVLASPSLPAPERPSFERLTIDRLTGALAHPYFRVRLGEELERAARYGRPLSLLLIDVDDLRGVNDRYGREVGDLVLQQIAQSLLAGARAVDRVGRWAGGAFSMLLPETGAGGAYGVAERLRADLAARRWKLPATRPGSSAAAPLRLTISCGVASLVHDGVLRPASLLQRADAALWRAKQSGRNRSVVD